MEDKEIKFLLERAKTIAVVGLSDNPERDSYRVAAYLQEKGYHVVPVNPAVTVVFGQKAYASLKDVPMPIDIVDIFRKPEAVPAIVQEAMAQGARVVWMQEGVVHAAAALEAQKHGVQVIMDKCIMKEHRKFIAS